VRSVAAGGGYESGVPAASHEQWIALKRLLDPWRPPLGVDLYVEPRRSPAPDIAGEMSADPASRRKVLLVGARGGGKSSELRRIRHLLGDQLAVAEVDLDRSGVGAGNVSALDLVYVSGVALLRFVEKGRARELFQNLQEAYADQDKEGSELGTFEQALAGIADFGGAVAAAAGVVGLAPGLALAAAPVLVATGRAIRLLSGVPGPIAETSPRGQRLLDAAKEVSEAVATNGRPPCVLVDGLELMNGQAAERFRDVFQRTRLIADCPWSAVFAAPPCTLSEASTVHGSGLVTRPVWGFGADEMDRLVDLLSVRFQRVGMTGPAGPRARDLRRIADMSGGLPRHRRW
jgi:hypothetical protein